MVVIDDRRGETISELFTQWHTHLTLYTYTHMTYTPTNGKSQRSKNGNTHNTNSSCKINNSIDTKSFCEESQ